MNLFLQTASTILQMKHNYISEIIVSMGTIFGVVLGWLLRYFSDNKGKVIISIDEYFDKISNKGEYAYNLIIFIYNNSIKPSHMKNIKIKFFNDRNSLLTSSPGEKFNEPSFRNIPGEKKIDIVSLCNYDLKRIILCDLIDGENYTILSQVKKIIMYYVNDDGKTKKVIIKNNFSINGVSKYADGEMFPK